jgi:hypothetical protein
MRRIFTLLILATLAACAQPAETGRMVADAQTAPFPPHLLGAVCVRSVTGGEATNPLWVSKVDDAGFREALTTTLRTNALLAGGSACPYAADVNLLGLSQPSAGFDMTVTSHVNYKLRDAGGKAVLLETITTPYTAAFGEHLIGVIRLQRANEGSIRANIAAFLDKLRGVAP